MHLYQRLGMSLFQKSGSFTRCVRNRLFVSPRFPPEAQEPKLLLRGFHKTAVLAPGEAEKVELSFTPRDFSVYSTSLGNWQLQQGVRIHLGASSADLRHSLEVPLSA